eukprot:CAMPEP_0119274322 /NCGR_PEP_ID=MMETSP1329-20130426/11858_1 /TAXON_ID=114041 /ORGANISM="Genus nov. species nov., Strain RCC1024" /LENGTH=192 /DNA_ID=CAMNT_0007274627 /DNA_START=201 /DNA_END=779 /DNA_ORIENTATION=+
MKVPFVETHKCILGWAGLGNHTDAKKPPNKNIMLKVGKSYVPGDTGVFRHMPKGVVDKTLQHLMLSDTDGTPSAHVAHLIEGQGYDPQKDLAALAVDLDGPDPHVVLSVDFTEARPWLVVWNSLVDDLDSEGLNEKALAYVHDNGYTCFHEGVNGPRHWCVGGLNAIGTFCGCADIYGECVDFNPPADPFEV